MIKQKCKNSGKRWQMGKYEKQARGTQDRNMTKQPTITKMMMELEGVQT